MRDPRDVIHAGVANLAVSLEVGGGENVPGIPGACTTRNFTYLITGPLPSLLLTDISLDLVDGITNNNFERLSSM